ncbi:hypothetical protein [Streptomyces sp. NPDC055243]|uniref:hypothetical protein n=1 Tax=Streptomyces sp. NPDC055243 TaxID=3365720 RepID=UPI0037D493C5
MTPTPASPAEPGASAALARSAWKPKRMRRKHPFLHGVFVPLAHKVKRDRTLHYEVPVLGE